ncbi:MAG: stage III sporulation protein AA [Lachnospiraceae bacterium]
MNELETVMRVLPQALRNAIKQGIKEINGLNEIRLRTGMPVYVKYKAKEHMLSVNGLCDESGTSKLVFTECMMKETVEYISNYSLYALEEEVGHGFVTILGGHRAGLCGRAVIADGRVKTIRSISSINIRVAHEVYGCSSKVIQYLFNKDGFVNTLIISPPGGGKTTLLRDIVRTLSEKGYTVGISDERSEIAAMYQGIIQNRLGTRVDVLDGCPKSLGIEMLIRTMSPDIIAVDEIGTERDVQALKLAAVSGCRVIASAHGAGLEDVKKNTSLSVLLEQGYFKRVIALKSDPAPGTIEGIFGDK